MKILIIETGLPPEPIGGSFGYYPQMLQAFLKNHEIHAHYEICSVIKGEDLPKPNLHNAVFIMGSPHGVYDDVPWIPKLMDFIRLSASYKVPQIGICFGHQLIAKAFGGVVEKAPQGWGIGRHTYEILHTPNFHGDKPLAQEINLLVSHQDQVLQKPHNAKTIAASNFTPHAVLHYEQENIITLQAHPEFSTEFSRALIESRRGTRFPHDLADDALKTLDKTIDKHIIGEMFAKFLHHTNKISQSPEIRLSA